MNMPGIDHIEPEPIDTPTPAGHEITPRDRRFGREEGYDPAKYWQNGDPVATAFYNCLSLTFPRGEAFFIESVKEFRDHTPPQLQKEIRAFVQQEVIHSREHLALNRRVEENGYDTSRIEQRITESLAMTKGRPKITNLAATMILEHFTAITAQQFLANPRHWKDSDEETADLWRWHALEEIEHKGVAYDTWLYATRNWSRWQRWKVKALMMLVITRNFWGNRWNDTLDLLAQDGITGWRVKLRLLKFLLVEPGIARAIIIPWIKFFLPGFHPWNEDDRHLIQRAESDYDAAINGRPAAA
ncbi:metal-dependent hydrolase [Sphingorhabdus sp. YGSMI21]|uniref:metal-dependent hydrolase n=1 Tax=Sphingorhabdus sp. YGSMI21 TaxID=2077182 RepID=UPI001F0BB808|nr:metal-dependent hydrolase [Sphingorhabdus sp. YGSMI21]